MISLPASTTVGLLRNKDERETGLWCEIFNMSNQPTLREANNIIAAILSERIQADSSEPTSEDLRASVCALIDVMVAFAHLILPALFYIQLGNNRRAKLIHSIKVTKATVRAIYITTGTRWCRFSLV